MYLVTGGSGFIGSAVVRQLVNDGQKVIIFSRSGNEERLTGLEQNIKIVKGDVTDFQEVKQTLLKYNVTCVIHLAFYTDINKLEINPAEGVKINCEGFINILEAARETGIKKVIWTSSAAVYGEENRYAKIPVNEESPFFPLNAYGAYKVFCECIGEHYHNKLKVKNIALRPTIVFGSGRWYRGAATYAYDLFYGPVTGTPVVIENGDQLIDWIYVKDLARAIVLAAKSENLKHRTFNICGHRASVREAAAIVKELRPSADINVLSGRYPMWVPYLKTDRAEKELGYKPLYSLEESFKEYMKEIENRCK